MAAKYISAAQAAKKLNVSVETIYNMCKSGKLGGRYIRCNTRGTWQIDMESVELLEKESSFKSIYQIKEEKIIQNKLF